MSRDQDASKTLIPAQPGWFLLEPLIGDDDRVSGLQPEPILAWLCELRGTDGFVAVDPITVEGGETEDREIVLQRPDGALTAPMVQDFQSHEEARAFLQEAREREQRNRQRLAARQAAS